MNKYWESFTKFKYEIKKKIIVRFDQNEMRQLGSGKTGNKRAELLRNVLRKVYVMSLDIGLYLLFRSLSTVRHSSKYEYGDGVHHTAK